MTVTYPYTTLDQCSPFRKQCDLYICPIEVLYIKTFSPETYDIVLAFGGPDPILHIPTTPVYCFSAWTDYSVTTVHL